MEINKEEHRRKIVRTIRRVVVLTIFLLSYIITHIVHIVKRSNIFKEIAVAVMITILALILVDMIAGLILTVKFYIEAHKKSKELKESIKKSPFTIKIC